MTSDLINLKALIQWPDPASLPNAQRTSKVTYRNVIGIVVACNNHGKPSISSGAADEVYVIATHDNEGKYFRITRRSLLPRCCSVACHALNCS